MLLQASSFDDVTMTAFRRFNMTVEGRLCDHLNQLQKHVT